VSIVARGSQQSASRDQKQQSKAMAERQFKIKVGTLRRYEPLIL
jgi:hypothetical protein